VSLWLLVLLEKSGKVTRYLPLEDAIRRPRPRSANHLTKALKSELSSQRD
jgi:hypothetical protein